MDTAEDFEEFARTQASGLYRAAWLLCGDRHGAEDLVQETLAKVYVRWRSRLRGRIDNPAAYARTTLTRTFLSARRRRSAGTALYADAAEAVDGHATASAGGPAGDPTGEEAQRRSDLHRLLATLSPTDRAVLVLRYLEDLSVEETAAQLDLTSGAVRNRAMRALAALRDQDAITDDPERTLP